MNTRTREAKLLQAGEGGVVLGGTSPLIFCSRKSTFIWWMRATGVILISVKRRQDSLNVNSEGGKSLYT